MTRRFEEAESPPAEQENWDQWREGIIGFGETSSRKSYYPELQKKLDEIEQTKATLAAANHQFQAVLDSASEVSIIATDRDGLITLFNRGAEKMLGYAAEEMVGRHTPSIFHAEAEVAACRESAMARTGRDMNGFEAIVDSAIENKVEWPEWTYVRKDGSRLLVSLTITVLRDTQDIIGYLGIAVDITERKRAEDALSRAKDELESRVQERTHELSRANEHLWTEIIEHQKAEEARRVAEAERAAVEMQLRQSQKLEAVGQLAAGIAHEINTPTQFVGDNIHFLKDAFTGINGAFEECRRLLTEAHEGQGVLEMVTRMETALASGDLPYLFSQIPDAIRDALEGVERITKIVRAMKEFSHPGEKEKNAADLNKAIGTTVTVARNEWKYVADLELDLDPALPLVPCYLGEFNQCMLNLIINAAHAIGEAVKQAPGTKGKITVNTRSEGGFAEIRVEDTGTGIPEAIRHRVFEPFFTTKEVGKGTGQGLSIVYNTIVKKHGGTVSFETETGKGTVFLIRLPIHPESESAAEPGSDGSI